MCQLLGIFAFAIFGFLAFKLFSNAKAMGDHLSDLGGQRTGTNKGVFLCEGQKVEVYYYPGSRNRAPHLRISFEGNFLAQARVYREKFLDQLAKKIGVNKEIQLNDPALDDHFYFECEDESFLRQWLGRPEAKTLLREILSVYQQVEITGRQCAAIQKPCYNFSKVDSQEILTFATKLVQLSQFIPRSAQSAPSATPATDDIRQLERLFIGIGIALAAIGFSLFLWGMTMPAVDTWLCYQHSFSYSLPLALGFIIYIFLAMRQKSRALKVIALSGLLCLFGFVHIGMGGAVVLNAVMDQAPRQVYQATVAGKRISRGRNNSRNYHLAIAAWPGNPKGYEFSVPRDMYDRLSYGDPCVIEIGRGALGYPWVASRSCNPR